LTKLEAEKVGFSAVLEALTGPGVGKVDGY
jgi:hypothetical protein